MFSPALKKGSIEMLVLALVESRPRHGYEIGKLIEARSGGRLTFAQCQMLAELKSRGYRVVHLQPKQSQSTIAEYDQRIERDRGNARPPRVAAVRPSLTPITRATPEQMAAPQQPPARRHEARDWRETIFGRW